jgi:hypothetical protein
MPESKRLVDSAIAKVTATEPRLPDMTFLAMMAAKKKSE